MVPDRKECLPFLFFRLFIWPVFLVYCDQLTFSSCPPPSDWPLLSISNCTKLCHRPPDFTSIFTRFLFNAPHRTVTSSDWRRPRRRMPFFFIAGFFFQLPASEAALALYPNPCYFSMPKSFTPPHLIGNSFSELLFSSGYHGEKPPPASGYQPHASRSNRSGFSGLLPLIHLSILNILKVSLQFFLGS